MPEDIAIEPVTFKKDGTLSQKIDGTTTTIAHYDRKTRHLEFETAEYSVKLIRQVTAAIGTVNKGTQSSGLTIETMGVKGQERDKPQGKVPPRPKRDPQFGDQTKAVVEWYFKYYPREAYIRYGVFLDENGDPVRKRVKRRVTQVVDARSENEPIRQQVGPKAWEEGPIGQVVTEDVIEDQIIARRSTHMTFAPGEVVGGFDTGDDSDDSGVSDREDES